ncbi:MAG: hypothetical protein ACRDYD_01415 [Acidimicrobiales bacterium]
MRRRQTVLSALAGSLLVLLGTTAMTGAAAAILAAALVGALLAGYVAVLVRLRQVAEIRALPILAPVPVRDHETPVLRRSSGY